MPPTDLQCGTLVEEGSNATGDVSDDTDQDRPFAARASAAGAVSIGGEGSSTCAALPGEEDWQLMPTAGADGLRRWAADRSRFRLRSERARPGRAKGTGKALAAAHGHMIVCLGCAALVDLQAARAAARRAGRRVIRRADGCYGCGPHRRVGRHTAGQRETAAAVLDGRRMLVERPQTAAGRSPLWIMPRSEAARCCHEALTALSRQA